MLMMQMKIVFKIIIILQDHMAEFGDQLLLQVKTYDNAGNTTPAVPTEFIDAAGVEVKVGSVSQIAAEQYLVKQKQVADNDIFELSGLVLGDHQSIFVSSTAAVSFSLIGFEETR